MKAPIKVGLSPGTRVLWLERWPGWDDKYNCPHECKTLDDGHWLLPLHTNPSRTLGTFLRLYDNGKIERVTVRDDQGDEIVLIKPEDGKGN